MKMRAAIGKIGGKSVIQPNSMIISLKASVLVELISSMSVYYSAS